MRLPALDGTALQNFSVGRGVTTNQNGDTGSKLREWSSLIGIITAIVGNILISFALNIQRYAHIRLSRDRNRRTKSWRGVNRKKQSGLGGYGTQQEGIAEERAKLNLNAPSDNEEDRSHRENYHKDGQSEETAPLRESYSPRSSSESTIRQSEKEAAEPESTTYLSSPYWWAGILLMTVGEAGNFLAYGFAPASIVSPLGVVALVSNCIIAPCLLKENFRQRDLWGVAVAIAGAVVVVLSAKTSETKMGQHDLWVAITRWEFELYLGITAALVLLLMWASSRYGDKTILIDLGLVGLFGGYTALSTKGVASLLSDTLWRALTFPITYLLVLVLVATALLQIRYVNRALQRFDSTQVIPTQFVLFTISVIIGSAVLYRDFESATKDRIGKFVGGCLLTFLGVYLLTSGRASENDADNGEDNADGEEDTIGLVDEEAHQDENVEAYDGETQRPSAGAAGHHSRKRSKRSSRAPFQQYDGRSSPPRTPRRMDSGISSVSSTPFSPGETPTSSVLENPWLTPFEQGSVSSKRQTLVSTISSPVIPFETQDLRPSTPRANTQEPQRALRPDRPSALSRSSMSRMIPGPLISPLSSPLSAIVADNLRRGIDSPARRRSRFARVGSSQKLRESPRGSEPLLGSSPLKTSQHPEGGSETTSAARDYKPRSLSISIGEFFRLKKGKGREMDTGPDDESASH